jgi:uncharacterized protein YkwD
MAVIISRGMDYGAKNTPRTQNRPPAPEAMPAPSPARTAGEDAKMTIDEMKAEIVGLTNAERAKAGLPALEILPELTGSAQAKAEDMLNNHYYGHISPVYGSPSKQIRLYAPNARSIAENLAPWTETPDEAFAGWVDSSEHLAHILSEKYTHIGVGIIEGANGGYWWVQHFAGF